MTILNTGTQVAEKIRRNLCKKIEKSSNLEATFNEHNLDSIVLKHEESLIREIQ